MTKIISILISLCMILNACTTDKTTIKPNPVVTRNGQDNNPDSNPTSLTQEHHNIKKQSKDNFSNESQIEDNYQDFTLKKNQQKSVNTVNTPNTLITPIKSNPNITKGITPKTPLEKENTINESNDSISKSSILDSLSHKEESTIEDKDNDTNETNKNDNKLDQQEPWTFAMLWQVLWQYRREGFIALIAFGGGILATKIRECLSKQPPLVDGKLRGKNNGDNNDNSNKDSLMLVMTNGILKDENTKQKAEIKNLRDENKELRETGAQTFITLTTTNNKNLKLETENEELKQANNNLKSQLEAQKVNKEKIKETEEEDEDEEFEDENERLQVYKEKEISKEIDKEIDENPEKYNINKK